MCWFLRPASGERRCHALQAAVSAGAITFRLVSLARIAAAAPDLSWSQTVVNLDAAMARTERTQILALLTQLSRYQRHQVADGVTVV